MPNHLAPLAVRLRVWACRSVLSRAYRRAAARALVLALTAGTLLGCEPSPDQVPPNPVIRPCPPLVGATGLRAQTFRARVGVDGIACISCAGPLLLAVANVPGVCGAQLRTSGDLLVDYQPTVVEISQILDVINATGYHGSAWSEGGPLATSAPR